MFLDCVKWVTEIDQQFFIVVCYIRENDAKRSLRLIRFKLILLFCQLAICFNLTVHPLYLNFFKFFFITFLYVGESIVKYF